MPGSINVMDIPTDLFRILLSLGGRMFKVITCSELLADASLRNSFIVSIVRNYVTWHLLFLTCHLFVLPGGGGVRGNYCFLMFFILGF